MVFSLVGFLDNDLDGGFRSSSWGLLQVLINVSNVARVDIASLEWWTYW